MKKVFNFISDCSHGWLKVPLSELARLGIENDISFSSYVRGEYAYLEEDCDYAVFAKAREARNEPFTIRESRTNRLSCIRNYAMYGGDRMVTKINLMSGEEYQERADTPIYCSPSSETYWSM